MAPWAFDPPPGPADEHRSDLKVRPEREVAQLQHSTPPYPPPKNEDQQMIIRSSANLHRISPNRFLRPFNHLSGARKRHEKERLHLCDDRCSDRICKRGRGEELG